MRQLSRTRRPLLALIALVAILLVGYATKATSDNAGGPATPGTTISHSTAISSAPQSTRQPAPDSPPHSTPGSSGSTPQSSGQVPLSSLPAQAQQTVALIERGGPFPYSRDGIVFGNNERHLPVKPRGYYHEYTVITPGSGDRGTRRIITGESGEYYYTDDHYASFVSIDVNR